MKTEITIRSTGFVYSFGIIRMIAEAMLPFESQQVHAIGLLHAMGLDPDIVSAMIEGRFEYSLLNDKGDCRLVTWH